MSQNIAKIKTKNEMEEKQEKIVTKKLTTHLCSTDKFPLDKWTKYVKNGYVKRVPDLEIEGKVIELIGPSNNVWIATPRDLDQKIGTTFNWLYFIIKALPEKQLILEVQVMDNSNVKRTFRFDTKVTATKLKLNLAMVDLNIKPGYWNRLEMDLSTLLYKNYGTRFSELCRIRIHGSCKLRRVFSSSAYVTEDEVPPDYRLCIANVFPP